MRFLTALLRKTWIFHYEYSDIAFAELSNMPFSFFI